MKLAIINCKSRKATKKCMVEQMYEPSKQFRVQKQFVKKHYDHYMVLSTKYGLVEPTDVIEPYDITLAKGARLKQKPSLSEQELKNWKSKVISQINELKSKFTEIDLHISNNYLKHINEVLDNKVKHIKQPVNPGLVIKRYEEAINSISTTNKVDLTKIGEKRKSNTPEYEKWWYHKEHGAVFGDTYKMKKLYNYLDLGNLGMVSRGINPHTCGWTISKHNLDLLEKTKKGKWRIKHER